MLDFHILNGLIFDKLQKMNRSFDSLFSKYEIKISLTFHRKKLSLIKLYEAKFCAPIFPVL